MSNNYIQKAKEKEKEANNVLNSWFSYFFNPHQFGDAARLFDQSAAFYYLVKNYESSAINHESAAECFLKSKEKYDAASSYINAAKMYRLCRNVGAMKACYQKGINFFKEEGKMTRGAIELKEIAEIMVEEGNLEEAINYYQEASMYYDAELQRMMMHGCLEKMADIHVVQKEYDKAALIFEKIAKFRISNHFLQYSATKSFLLSSLCYIASNDVVIAEKHIKTFCLLDVNFSFGKEGLFISDLLNCSKLCLEHDFEIIITKHHERCHFDEQQKNILLDIKKNISKINTLL